MTSTRFLLRSAAVLVALVSPLAPAVAADEVCAKTWAADIQPIVNQYCVVCHQNASPAQNLTLQRGGPPANLIGVPSTEAEMPLITPGKPEQSYLFLKLLGEHLEAGGSGDRMPLGGELPGAERDRIEAWITACPG
jgi:hypothetical protein